MAAIGYNFKSNIIFYNILGNINNKILFKIYKNQILEPVVKFCLTKSQDFILEKDDNSKHEKAKTCNIVCI